MTNAEWKFAGHGHWLHIPCGYAVPFGEAGTHENCTLPTTPTDRRMAAVGRIVNYWGWKYYDFAATIPDADVVAIIGEIDELMKLGRTERWRKAVRQWQHMVNGNRDRWALLQGSVYMNHAA